MSDDIILKMEGRAVATEDTGRSPYLNVVIMEDLTKGIAREAKVGAQEVEHMKSILNHLLKNTQIQSRKVCLQAALHLRQRKSLKEKKRWQPKATVELLRDEKNKTEKGSAIAVTTAKLQMVKKEVIKDLNEITDAVKKKIWSTARRFNHVTFAMSLVIGSVNVTRHWNDIRRDPTITFVRLSLYMPLVMVIGVPAVVLNSHL